MLIHPAHELLALMVMALHTAMPLGVWAMLSGYQDRHARIWLAGVFCYSAAFSLSALNTLAYSDTNVILLCTFYLTSTLLMLEALARDLGPSRRSPWVLVIALVTGGAYFSALTFQGLHPTWGLMSLSSLLVLFAGAAMFLSYRLIKRLHTRSLYLIIVALLLLMSGHLLRLTMMALGAAPATFQVAAFTWNSNYLVLSTVLAMVLISFGYWGYVLEKMRHQQRDVQVKQLAAEMLAKQSQQLIKERDQWMMLNARVSAISSLSSFSAMLIHDISQPLQALEFGLHELQAQAHSHRRADQLLDGIQALQGVSSQAAAMVSHLRQLMVQGQGQDHIHAVDAQTVLPTIWPILQSEASQRHVSLICHPLTAPSCYVRGNAVILQRMIFSTVGNSLDALSRDAHESPEIIIRLFQRSEEGVDWVILEIKDNGDGFSEEVLAQLDSPLQTTQPHSLGLGLMLTQGMVRMWDGRMVIGKRPAAEGSGALVQFWLRLILMKK